MVPMKYSLKEGSEGDLLPGFKSKNENLQLISSLTSLPKSKILKAQIRLFPDCLGILSIAISFYILFVYGSLSVYLFLIFFLLFFDRPSNVEVMPGKVTINRPMRRPVVIPIEDIMQISEKKNNNYSLRWIFRLIYIGLLLSDLINYWNIMNFHYLVQTLLPLSFLILISESWVPYKCDLKIITSRSVLRLWPLSNLKLRIYIYTKKQEGLIRILKEEIK
jgi:hypothetical protein